VLYKVYTTIEKVGGGWLTIEAIVCLNGRYNDICNGFRIYIKKHDEKL
jgi:hypothetical protein